jgi:cell division protein FtsB
MALFGSTKGYLEYKKDREEEAIDGLNKKLKKETKRREGAEREIKLLKSEVKRLKEEIRILNQIAMRNIEIDGVKFII